MGDSLRMVHSSKKFELKAVTTKKQSADCLIASTSKGLPQKASKCFTSVKQGLFGSADTGDIGIFMAKTVSLEIVRRYSRTKCPAVWYGLQALQVLCYPPFKWIQTWAPFKFLIRYIQTLSRPLLVLTIATIFSNQSACTAEKSDNLHDPRAYSESQQEPSSRLSTSETRSSDEVSKSAVTENWLQKLYDELEKQGITLPERFHENELRRFYVAANGDLSRSLSSIKKTIRWRQTYIFLSPSELEAWSRVVFWHGYDMQQRPCLIIRLGFACSNMTSNNRPFFVKAVVSRIEHRVMYLDDGENPQITVLMDCEGLSPFGFPVQMMRSCAILLQDHYPNRLGYLIIIRLPPIARMITQTLFQVMRPPTRQKLRIIGENYQKVLSEYLQELPSFLGGNCLCPKCSDEDNMHDTNEETILMRPSQCLVSNENLPSQTVRHLTETRVNEYGDQVMRIALIVLLMVWVFIAFVLARAYPDCLYLLIGKIFRDS